MKIQGLKNPNGFTSPVDYEKWFWNHFWLQVDRTSECWIWNGRRIRRGYGNIRYRTRPTCTHRLVYQTLVGEIPEGFVLDHLCRNPPCCNPAHLEPVTDYENIMRGVGLGALNARKTTCAKGHELTPRKGTTWRACLVCNRARNRKAIGESDELRKAPQL